MTKLGITFLNKSLSGKKERKHELSATFILLAFMVYQFVLCFINTNVFAISNGAVAATEGLLLALLAWRVFPTCRLNEFAAVLCLLIYFMVLWAIRGEIDTAGPRDVLVILLAYALGRAEGDKEAADKTLWIISGVVLFWGGVEYIFTDAYYHVFDILHYYIARGEISESVQSWVHQNSFVSGLRPEGRNIFPFLGDIRVSSIFLEPVSMGNYAIVVCLWALSFDMKDIRKAAPHFVVSLILIIACDSRFASILIFFLLVSRFVPGTRKKGFVLALPILAVGGLIAFTLLGLGNADDDNLSGRLMRSGLAVLDMDFAQLMGMGIPDGLGDMGVAFALEHFGVFLCIILWAAFVAFTIRDIRASRFRSMLAIYCLTILSISGTSFFSTKTGMLAWFLYGVLCSKKKSSDDFVISKNSNLIADVVS